MLRNKIMAFYTAFKAGWIASRCKTGCVIDDETETIQSCIFHRSEITKLEAENARYAEEK